MRRIEMIFQSSNLRCLHRMLMKVMTFTVVSAVYLFNLSAQDRVTVTQNQYYLKGDSVYVELQIEMNQVQIAKRAFVLLTPVIQKDSLSLELPAVMINGKNRQKTYLRMVALGREPVGLGKVIDAGEKNASLRKHQFKTAVAYEPWMKEADFSVHEDQCDCGGPKVKMSFDLMAEKIQNMNSDKSNLELNLTASFKEPNPEPVKTRSETGVAYLDFPLGGIVLNPNYMKNAEELAKIGELVDKIKKYPEITINRINIVGYASPDGSEIINKTISNKRSASLKDYICNTYMLDDKLFKVTGYGEDWTTFEKLISASNVSYREDVLEIISNTDDFDAREKKLMDLQGGVPYKDMLANFFPKLRRSKYEFQYTVIPFTIEEGKKQLEINPSLLSLNELFLIAKTYPVGSDEFNHIFDIAVNAYPDSEIANFNAAANALTSHQIEAAQKYLAQVATHDAAYYNNLGVLTAIQGKYLEAAEHFLKSVEQGNVEAVKNLAKIEKVK